MIKMYKLLFVVMATLYITIATVVPTGNAESVAEPISVTETETTTELIETTTEPIETTTTEPPTKTMLVEATAYCSCDKCCGEYADGITASGVKAKANHTIAVDKNVIPLGTVVLINGKQYVSEDTGGAIKGNRIDIYFDCHEQALEWGRQQIEIEVLL
jgi:3D (Asp-Asp-Asp) domain-containing protein